MTTAKPKNSWYVAKPPTEGDFETTRYHVVAEPLPLLIAEVIGKKNAFLIAEAGTVYNQTGIAPIQLYGQWLELVKKLSEANVQLKILYDYALHMRVQVQNEILGKKAQYTMLDLDSLDDAMLIGKSIEKTLKKTKLAPSSKS